MLLLTTTNGKKDWVGIIARSNIGRIDVLQVSILCSPSDMILKVCVRMLDLKGLIQADDT